MLEVVKLHRYAKENIIYQDDIPLGVSFVSRTYPYKVSVFSFLDRCTYHGMTIDEACISLLSAHKERLNSAAGYSYACGTSG